MTQQFVAKDSSRSVRLVQATYTVQQQVHYLSLQAEIDSLLLQQQAIKAQRQAKQPAKS